MTGFMSFAIEVTALSHFESLLSETQEAALDKCVISVIYYFFPISAEASLWDFFGWLVEEGGGWWFWGFFSWSKQN